MQSEKAPVSTAEFFIALEYSDIHTTAELYRIYRAFPEGCVIQGVCTPGRDNDKFEQGGMNVEERHKCHSSCNGVPKPQRDKSTIQNTT